MKQTMCVIRNMLYALRLQNEVEKQKRTSNAISAMRAHMLGGSLMFFANVPSNTHR